MKLTSTTQNSKLARIVADITGDGHLQLDNRRGVVSFYSKDIEKIKKEDGLFQDVFCIKGHIYTYTKRSIRYGIMFTSKELAKFLSKLGTPVGSKVSSKFLIPDWIFSGKKEIKRAYLLGMFTGEGSIYKSKHSGWRLEIEQYKLSTLSTFRNKYMKQLKKMVEDFGIKCSPVMCCRKNERKDKSITEAWKFYIWKGSFKIFYKEIGFDDNIKMEKLNEAINAG